MPDELDHIIDASMDPLRNRRQEIPDPGIVLDSVFDKLDEKKKKRRAILFYWIFGAGFLLTGILSRHLFFSSQDAVQTPVYSGMEACPPEHADFQSIHATSLAPDEVSVLVGQVKEEPVKKESVKRTHTHNISKKEPQENVDERNITDQADSTGLAVKKDPVDSIPGTDTATNEAYINEQPVREDSADFIVMRPLQVPVSYRYPDWRRNDSVPVKQKPKTYFSIGAFASFHFCAYNIVHRGDPGSSSYEVSKEYREKLSSDNPVNAGFDIGLSLHIQRRKFVFETGFTYTRYTFYKDFTDQTIFYPDVMPVDPRVPDAYNCFEIPLIFGMNFRFKKFSITPGVGFTIGTMIVSTQYDYISGSHELMYNPRETNLPTLLSPMAKIDFNFPLPDNMMVSVGPMFRHNSSSLQYGTSDDQIFPFPYSFGLRLAFRHQLGKPVI